MAGAKEVSQVHRSCKPLSHPMTKLFQGLSFGVGSCWLSCDLGNLASERGSGAQLALRLLTRSRRTSRVRAPSTQMLQQQQRAPKNLNELS
eukprot:4074613-Amphidinium_carterae.2